MQTLKDKLRCAIYQGLEEGERAIELADRVLAIPEIAEAQARIAELERELETAEGDAKWD